MIQRNEIILYLPLFAKLIDNPAANWLYESEPDDGADNRRIPVPRGKLELRPQLDRPAAGNNSRDRPFPLVIAITRLPCLFTARPQFTTRRGRRWLHSTEPSSTSSARIAGTTFRFCGTGHESRHL